LVATLLPNAWDGATDAYADTSLGGLQQRLDDLTGLAADPNTTDTDKALIQAEIDDLTAAIGTIKTSDQLVALTTATNDVSTLEDQVAADQSASRSVVTRSAAAR